MKKFFIAILLAALSSVALFSAETNTSATTTAVTVQDYCCFLNAVAATSDPYLLYNEEMASDIDNGCILCTEKDGRYWYEPLAGTEGNPVVDVNWFDKARYCNWL